jgi:hypothetical protein
VGIIQEYGCGHWSIKRQEGIGCCVPECRYYPEYGRIEDEEVITKLRELEDPPSIERKSIDLKKKQL